MCLFFGGRYNLIIIKNIIIYINQTLQSYLVMCYIYMCNIHLYIHSLCQASPDAIYIPKALS